MQKTTNLGLNKPEYSDVADIADINENMDIIDKELEMLSKGKAEIKHTHSASDIVEGGTISGDLQIDGNVKIKSAYELEAKTIKANDFKSRTDTSALYLSDSASTAKFNCSDGFVVNAQNGETYIKANSIKLGDYDTSEVRVTAKDRFKIRGKKENDSPILDVNPLDDNKATIKIRCSDKNFISISPYEIALAGNVFFDSKYNTDFPFDIEESEYKFLENNLQTQAILLKRKPIEDVMGKSYTFYDYTDFKSVTQIAKEGATVIGDLRERTYIEGDDITGGVATGYYATAIGRANAIGDYSVAIGGNSYSSAYASGIGSVAVNTSIASGENSFSANSSKAEGEHSVSIGLENTAKDFQTVIGKYADVSEGPIGIHDSSGDLFKVGNGYQNSNTTIRRNAFRVSAEGNCYAYSSMNSSGADFAEYFEWLDGNENNEDRRGLFVTLEVDKIRLANEADNYILGVVSAMPTIIGNSGSEIWQGAFIRDAFGNVVIDEKTNTPKLNPDYNKEQAYISRENRKEWSAIGLIGTLVVCDDGKCKANGYCKAGEGGIAISSDSGYRVIKRVDNKHIKIIVK